MTVTSDLDDHCGGVGRNPFRLTFLRYSQSREDARLGGLLEVRSDATGWSQVLPRMRRTNDGMWLGGELPGSSRKWPEDCEACRRPSHAGASAATRRRTGGA